MTSSMVENIKNSNRLLSSNRGGKLPTVRWKTDLAWMKKSRHSQNAGKLKGLVASKSTLKEPWGLERWPCKGEDVWELRAAEPTESQALWWTSENLSSPVQRWKAETGGSLGALRATQPDIHSNKQETLSQTRWKAKRTSKIGLWPPSVCHGMHASMHTYARTHRRRESL